MSKQPATCQRCSGAFAAATLLCLLVAAAAAAGARPEGGKQCLSPTVGAEADACMQEEEGVPEASVVLLQTGLRFPRQGSLSKAYAGNGRDLVFTHVPFNFGHTIEKVAAFGPGSATLPKFHALMGHYGGFSGSEPRSALLPSEAQPTGVVWGHAHPDLQAVSNVTGCPMYWTPPKFWPTDLAKRYFGNKTIFGMLRDPYERLVAFFRGNIPGYGGSYPEFVKTCDVDGAVRTMMERYLAGGNKFAEGCTFLPQAEYYDGHYGIQLPVDNRQFPASMNKVFAEHNYSEMVIGSEDIYHVTGCPDVWAADLKPETRKLVRQVYARDFDLLCKHFGYCDVEENCCIWQVSQMCPSKVMAQGYKGHTL